MKRLSKVAYAVKESSTIAVDSLAKQMKDDGLDVILFGTGEPDFDTPDNIKDAAIKAINGGLTKYTPAAGIPQLRQAAADRLRMDFDLDYSMEQIVVASGAKHNIYIALCVLLDPGDEVIIPAPFWVSYYQMVKMAGGVPKVIYTDKEQDYKLTAEMLQAAVTDKTKVFLLNNPVNPTGMVYGREDLTELAEVCKQKDLYVISDEIYCNLVYDNREFVSFPSISEDAKERTILINGVSKSYAMTGWRVGYSASNLQIAQAMTNFLSHSTGAPGTMNQWAAVEALVGHQDVIETMRAVFELRRNYIVERINRIPDVSCRQPEGAFYVMMSIEKLIGRMLGGRIITNDADFATALLETEHVAVVPCLGFGVPNYVRWTYATSMENIREGLDRLEHFLSQ